jgi:hypothetical protein
MESVPHYLQSPKFDIKAYINQKLDTLVQDARERYTTQYLPRELGRIALDCKEEHNAFDSKYSSLVGQLKGALSQGLKEAVIKLIKWGPDVDCRGIQMKMHEEAIGLFLTELRERGYPFYATVKEESAQDLFEGMCLVHTDVITVTLV